MRLLAQAPQNLGRFTGIGPLGTVGDDVLAVIQFTGIVSNVIGVLTVSAGLWFIFQVLGGAIQWISSGSEKQSLQNAQKRIANAIVGLVVVIMSYTIIGVVGLVFGLPITHLGVLISLLRP